MSDSRANISDILICSLAIVGVIALLVHVLDEQPKAASSLPEAKESKPAASTTQPKETKSEGKP